jgi:hypothetical protein
VIPPRNLVIRLILPHNTDFSSDRLSLNTKRTKIRGNDGNTIIPTQLHRIDSASEMSNAMLHKQCWLSMHKCMMHMIQCTYKLSSFVDFLAYTPDGREIRRHGYLSFLKIQHLSYEECISPLRLRITFQDNFWTSQ